MMINESLNERNHRKSIANMNNETITSSILEEHKETRRGLYRLLMK
jgi:hypothetical protein